MGEYFSYFYAQRFISILFLSDSIYVANASNVSNNVRCGMVQRFNGIEGQFHRITGWWVGYSLAVMVYCVNDLFKRNAVSIWNERNLRLVSPIDRLWRRR